jgi:hypothetical protein
MALKLITSTDRPLSRADLFHVGEADDEFGRLGDLAAWVTPDGRIMLCWQDLEKPPGEDAKLIVLDPVVALRLAERLRTLTAEIVKALQAELGEGR